ncbi:MAG: D-alanyl-D-alanine carboxypeptidase [Muricauda sp.]|nr:D-alanyl-D-alanine carboxypeptidase [Allomuricauda sp.]MAU26773.1 D-alanyl-D-alanine carboxypeptidase [Allomuricauda sp.]MBC31860.1 D-alanyl-D-alanine carboxypeptidase [Allomuricauda sp.]|tara:strand:+ start:16282 stop:17592 length:1311 start_codon:yes stop_codon:yes gene_type:complete
MNDRLQLPLKQRIRQTWVYVFICLMVMGACAPAKHLKIKKQLDVNLSQTLFENHFLGLLVIDPETNDTLYVQNSKKYFIPASNTKIFTLFTALKLLPEHVPSLKYLGINDTLYVEGTGDPSALHPYFNDSTALNFLKGHQHIALFLNNFQDDRFGPGWAWGDYQWYYSPERSPLPLYGNVVTVYKADSLVVSPSYFADKLIALDYRLQREENENVFYFDPARKDTVEIPFRVDSTLTRHLLEEALQKKLTVVNKMPEGEKQVLFGMSRDSLCRRMMLESDNFLAEQLLVMASSTLSDTLFSQKARAFVLDSLLTDLKQPPRWVDGSGLSRYNLFTPESMVQVLHHLYKEMDRDRLFGFFPAGGVSGTLENWYATDGNPYIYAKTGSLGNNHNLSGYLITKSGKVLIFSFMNNHFRLPSAEVKKQMQAIFEFMRDTY